jgi:hypothetical protein
MSSQPETCDVGGSIVSYSAMISLYLVEIDDHFDAFLHGIWGPVS